MKQMSKWERIEAAINGDPVDRVPLSFWRHYAVQEWSPRSLAQLTLDLVRRHDLDIIKLTPTGIYPTQDWGPTVRFSQDDAVHPAWIGAAVTETKQWATLPKLNINAGALGRELEAIRFLKAGLSEDIPFVMTIYSPLTIAAMLCWTDTSRDRITQDLREAPQQLHAGLTVIRDVVQEYALACLEAGVTGLFLATQMAHYDALSEAEYREFGMAYDLPILEAVQGKSRLTMLHVCRQNVMFDLMIDYPVDVIHWNDRAGEGPSLAEGQQKTTKALSGGIATSTLLNGSPAAVRSQVQDAIAQTKGRGFILAPTCTIDGRTAEKNLQAMRQAIEETRS